jgi:hypothetical protein
MPKRSPAPTTAYGYSESIIWFKSIVLRIEERHEVYHVGIGRLRLVFPIREPRPQDDLVVLSLQAYHRLIHQGEIDDRHAPAHGLDGAPLNGPAGEFVSGKI